MNRRNFLKQAGGLLAAIPAMAWTKEEMPPSYGATPDEHWADDLYFGEEGSLYIKGDFLLETPEQIRQRHAEWNNSSFKVESDGSFSDREVFSSDDLGPARWNGNCWQAIDYRDFYQPHKLARMDDAGYWESTDGGETWQLTIDINS